MKLDITAIKFIYTLDGVAELISFCGSNIVEINKARHPDAVAVAYITARLDKTTFKEIKAREGDYIVKDSTGYIMVVEAVCFDRIYTQLFASPPPTEVMRLSLTLTDKPKEV